MDYFCIPLKGLTVGTDRAYNYVKTGTAIKDPKIVFDDGNETITIQYAFGELQDIKVLLGYLRGVPNMVLTRDAMIDKYGTAAYKKKVANYELLDQSRESLRDMPNQPAPDTSRINFGDTGSNATRDLLKAQPGICLARGHGQKASLDLLLEQINSGQAEMLFLEEFTEEEQGVLDTYLQSTDPKLPEVLQRKVATLKSHSDEATGAAADWEPILKAAQAKKTKIYAIDKGEARDVTADTSWTEATWERRDLLMNAYVKQVMDGALRDLANKGKKYCAVVGAAHANTHRGGIPGVCQMYGIPAIRVDDHTKKVVLDVEDQTLRGMPSRDQQSFIDAYIEEVEKEEPDSPNKPKGPALRAQAVQAAQDAQANGTLPTFEEQIYIEQYIKEMRKGPGKDFDITELKYAAKKKAKALSVAGQLNRGVDILTKIPNATDLNNEMADAHAKYESFRKLKNLVEDSDNPDSPIPQEKGKAFLKQLKKAPDLSDVSDRNGNTLLHIVAKKADATVLKGVYGIYKNLAVNTATVSNAKDKEGNTPLHAALARRLGERGDDPKHDVQDACLQVLLDKNGNINAQNKAGLTPAHFAARNNNVKAVKALFDRGANTALQDQRGWTPLQLAQAVGSADSEKKFYTENKAVAGAGGDPNAKVTTIDMLVKATLCEDPADILKIRAAYQKLYTTPALKPIVELAALSAAGPRNPPAGAPRFVVAKGKNVSNVYVPVERQQAPAGAYDHTANVVMIPNTPGAGEDLASILCHEMTHLSAHIINGHGANVVPVPNDQTGAQIKADYIAALEADVKNMHLVKGGAVEDRIRDRIMSRLDKYAKTMDPNKTGEDAILEEALVSVPQLIAEFGEDAVKDCAPELTKFLGKHTARCTAQAKSATFAKARKTIDDTSIANLPPHTYPTPTLAPEWIGQPDAPKTVTELLAAVKTDYTVRNGQASAKDANGTTIPFIYDTASAKLTQAEEQELTRKLAKVQKALEKSLSPELLTLDLSREGMNELIQDISQRVKNKPETDLDKEIITTADAWLLREKHNFIQYKNTNQLGFNEQEIAEAVVLAGETKVAGKTDYTVNSEKHAKLVASMKKNLEKMSPDKKDSFLKQSSLMLKLQRTIQADGDKKQGVYQKPDRTDPDHVSLDVKTAKNLWLKKLAKL
jgi:ankyrin repeat protein